MAPLTLALLGGSALGLFLLGKKASGKDFSAIKDPQARFVAAMTAQTRDPELYANEAYYFALMGNEAAALSIKARALSLNPGVETHVAALIDAAILRARSERAGASRAGTGAGR